MFRVPNFALLPRLTLCFLPFVAVAARSAEPVDFNRDIRPILSNKCFRCHGPDEAKRKGGNKKDGGLRLDVLKIAVADLGGYAAIVPGDAEGSELVTRITSVDSDEVMPPPELGKPLDESEVELLVKWIDEGAHYARHWAYVNPREHAIIPKANKAWG